MFRKNSEPKSAAIEPEVETAVLLCQYEKGGKTVGFTKISGVKMIRPASLRDMYRMICEMKMELESIETNVRLASMLQPQPAPIIETPPAPEKPEDEIKKETVAEGEKKEEPKNETEGT